MKILHIINSLEIGGAQRLLSDLIPIQIQQGLEVDVLVGDDKESKFSEIISNSECNILKINRKKYKSFSGIRTIRQLIRDYDIVHVHLFPSLYLVALASLGLKTKLIYTEHSTSNRRRDKAYLRPIEQFIYKQYDKIISISQQTQTALQKWLQSYDNRFVVINNGVDVRKFEYVKSPVKNKSLIMISRFVPAKDQATAIKALQYLDSDITLTLVGDGENLDHCKNLAQTIGVYDRINFLGSRSDVPELISSSYIGIQSSNWEGFGLTAVEIMAAGKPVIASDVDGLKQVVEGAGIIFQNGNANQLAEKIKLLINNKDLYNAVSSKCNNRASQFDIKHMAYEYNRIYNE
ncbi:MAG: glycosyltransferase family 4 protein [Clostridia bacterium]|nr:glycosyltransferase family 4 protein [Clostridia bacterium]